MQEGKQFFVNRITFIGNTTTHDNVIRREMRAARGRRLQHRSAQVQRQAAEPARLLQAARGQKAIEVEKTPGAENKVDVKLKFEEQNRNQLTFGAGVSQFDGFFGQLSFQTSNFLGRGETVHGLGAAGQPRDRTTSSRSASRSSSTGRITAGVDVFIREFEYIGRLTQESHGGNLVYGLPVAGLRADVHQLQLREQSRCTTSTRRSSIPWCWPATRSSPTRCSSARAASGTVSKISPELRLQHRRPADFPDGRHAVHAVDRHRRASAATPTTSSRGPRASGYIPITRGARRSACAPQAEYIRPYASTTVLPIFEKIFLGGEYSIRGFDIRTVGPRDPFSGVRASAATRACCSTREYLINIAGPVRLVAVLRRRPGARHRRAVRVEGDRSRNSSGRPS